MKVVHTIGVMEVHTIVSQRNGTAGEFFGSFPARR